MAEDPSPIAVCCSADAVTTKSTGYSRQAKQWRDGSWYLFFGNKSTGFTYHVPIFSLLNRRFSLGIAYFETVPNGHGSNKLAANIGWFKTRVATTCGTFEEVRLNSCGHGQNHWPQELDWTLGRTVPICGSMKLAFLIPLVVPASTKNQAQRPYEMGLLLKQNVFSHGFCENLEVLS